MNTPPFRLKWDLTSLIFASLVAGIVFGLVLRVMDPTLETESWLVEGVLKAGGELFFAALRMLVVPVVFVSLICGVGALDDVTHMGRIGIKTIALYLATTVSAIVLALFVAELINPGAGFQLTSNVSYQSRELPSLTQVVIGFVPSNPVQALAEANMIQVIVLALLIGVALATAGDAGRRMLAWFEDLNQVVMRLVGFVMATAPVGVFCLLAVVIAKQGYTAVLPLSKYFFTVLLILALHLFLVYGLLIQLFAKMSPIQFFKKFRRVMTFAFSTSSSNATVPVAIETVTTEFKVSRAVAAFTLPLGATINMDGTAIMQGVATVFISQVYGIEIGWSGYAAVIGTATVAAIGSAGAPGVGLVTLAMVLRHVGLPVEGIGLIIGVDRLLDMARTVVNVTGDAAVTCIVARSEQQIEPS